MDNTRPSNRTILLIGGVSNLLEWYEFSIYGYMATTLAVLFFNDSNPRLAVLKAFMLFSVSFLVRPIGAFILGYLADIYGRGRSLKLSLACMAVSTFLIGCLPTYADAGAAAVFLLITLRIIQGFSAGGEIPVSACFVYEAAPEKEKIFYTATVNVSSMMGVLLGGVVVTLLHFYYAKEAILNYAWRIPFLMSIILSAIVFYFRRHISDFETIHKNKPSNSIKTYLSQLATYKSEMFQFFCVNGFLASTFYMLFVWLPTYTIQYLDMKPVYAYLLANISLLLAAGCLLFFARFAKNKSDTSIFIKCYLVILIFMLPFFNALKAGYPIVYLSCFSLIIIAWSRIAAVLIGTTISRIDERVRAGVIALAVTTSTALFGGLMPTLVSWFLYHEIGTPAFALMLVCILTMPAARSFALKHSTVYAA